MAITLSMTPQEGCSANRLVSDIRRLVKDRYPSVSIKTRKMGVANRALVVASVTCPPEMIAQPVLVSNLIEEVQEFVHVAHFGVELNQSMQLATEI